MTQVRLLWQDYRYFPYERMLAQREARLFFQSEPIEAEGGLTVPHHPQALLAAQRLTYFKAIESPDGTLVPAQAKLEASGNGNGQSWDPTRDPIPSLRRQSTRYSAHGLHEYRGKFNPQVV